MTDKKKPVISITNETQDVSHEATVLKTVVAVLAVSFIAAPVAYGAYEINDLSAPTFGVWRWPVIFVLAVIFGLLAWWVVVSVRRNFPYS